MVTICEKLGVLPRELEDIWIENTPQYDLYEDKTQNQQIFPQLAEELEPMSEIGDHYIGAEKLLPWGDHIAKSHVVAWSHDANKNVMGRAHTNAILDTSMYQVELAGGKFTELTTNIAESMYAQCDADGNEYFILKSLVDYHKVNETISLTD